MTDDACECSLECQKAVSPVPRWDVHSAWPFTRAHNATKVWWLRNLLKSGSLAKPQVHSWAPGSLPEETTPPPQIPTQIKHADDITVSKVLLKKNNPTTTKTPSGLPLCRVAGSGKKNNVYPFHLLLTLCVETTKLQAAVKLNNSQHYN